MNGAHSDLATEPCRTGDGPTVDATVISIIIPCLNEEAFIAKCLASVRAFSVPDGMSTEILVLDGGSTDRTIDLVTRVSGEDHRVRLLPNPGRYQSHAMNLGVRQSRGAWIMRLDAHAEYPADYLTLCHKTALDTGADNTGGSVVTLPGGQGYSAQLVQALTTHKFGVGDSSFRTGGKDQWVDTVPFGYFRREVFAHVGWFDERLVRAQDYEFNRRIIAAGGRIRLNSRICVRYFNQPTLFRFLAKQLIKEAPYNAYLWYLAPHAFAPRHAITGVFALGVLGGLALSPFTPWIASPFYAVMGVYLLLAVVSAGQQAMRYRRLSHLFVLPFCFFSYHAVHGMGVLLGLARLLTRTAPVLASREPWPSAGRHRAWPSSPVG